MNNIIYREVNLLAQGETANEWQSHNSKTRSLSSESVFFDHSVMLSDMEYF